ncbi:MAG: hypothetical protein ACAH80_11660 [Alphaproteobacteria bacterium]
MPSKAPFRRLKGQSSSSYRSTQAYARPDCPPPAPTTGALAQEGEAERQVEAYTTGATVLNHAIKVAKPIALKGR